MMDVPGRGRLPIASTPASSGPQIVVGSSTGQHAAKAWFKAHQTSLRTYALDVSAATLGLTRKALLTEARTGESIAQVAEEHGVSAQKLTSVLTAATRARVDTAVRNHRLTRKQADKVDALLPAHLHELINRVYRASRVRRAVDGPGRHSQPRVSVRESVHERTTHDPGVHT